MTNLNGGNDSSSMETSWRPTPGAHWGEFPSSSNCPAPGSMDEQYQYSYSRGLFPCPQCNKVYQYKYTLGTHLRYECGKEPQFQCPYCPHRSKLKGNLMKHVRKIHANLMGPDMSSASSTAPTNLGTHINQLDDVTMTQKDDSF